MKEALKIIKKLEQEWGKILIKTVLKERLLKGGYTNPSQTITDLQKQGILTEPKKGYLTRTERTTTFFLDLSTLNNTLININSVLLLISSIIQSFNFSRR